MAPFMSAGRINKLLNNLLDINSARRLVPWLYGYGIKISLNEVLLLFCSEETLALQENG